MCTCSDWSSEHRKHIRRIPIWSASEDQELCSRAQSTRKPAERCSSTRNVRTSKMPNFNQTFCSATHNISFMQIHAPWITSAYPLSNVLLSPFICCLLAHKWPLIAQLHGLAKFHGEIGASHVDILMHNFEQDIEFMGFLDEIIIFERTSLKSMQ